MARLAFRIAQEALANVRKHAHARTVTVEVSSRRGGLLLRVTDDGVGFDVEAAGREPGHLGLASMRERAELAGGELRVESGPGEGRPRSRRGSRLGVESCMETPGQERQEDVAGGQFARATPSDCGSGRLDLSQRRELRLEKLVAIQKHTVPVSRPRLRSKVDDAEAYDFLKGHPAGRQMHLVQAD
ncbi:MAG: hypothetical protein KatS3mg013_1238 [Actinomycetota bacterium]|nr:MAG: hypothetical protein KatS3mg013_1238 [Actinomycetota bacterium]